MQVFKPLRSSFGGGIRERRLFCFGVIFAGDRKLHIKYLCSLSGYVIVGDKFETNIHADYATDNKES